MLGNVYYRPQSDSTFDLVLMIFAFCHQFTDTPMPFL
jgi:hypothetical protein